jgi:hypothetical protein
MLEKAYHSDVVFYLFKEMLLPLQNLFLLAI